jgi:heptose I phosphotransferase
LRVATIWLRDDLRALWGETGLFERVFALEGDVYRAVASRRTLRVEAGGRAYFAKIHRGVGWVEVLKNLLTLRRPVVSARNEYAACRHLAANGVRAPAVAAFGERGWNPARRESFVVCDALDGFTNLEDLTAEWSTAPASALERRRLLMAVAGFARGFHATGTVHRDFYLCHLLLDRTAWAAGRAELAVLDLHRARIFGRLPVRWRRRDLAALLFSTLDLPYGRRSWYRFVRVYTGRPLREVFAQEGSFWRGVERRARRLYRKGLRKGIVRGREAS